MLKEIFVLQNPWRENKDYSFNLKKRNILNILLQNIDNELIIGLVGSRQVGKSSLLFLLIEKLLKSGIPSENVFYFNLDDFKLHQLFSSIPEFIEFIGKNEEKKFVFIDEIQRLKSPGLFLKEIYDLKRNIKIIYSGSSQLEVKSKTKEHLVGRSRTFVINRLSFNEYIDFAAPITKNEALNEILLYGSYPAVAKQKSSMEKQLRIKDIFQAYVQKDLVDFLNLNDVDLFNKFLTRIALQTGELLNIHSISNSLGISKNTTEKFLNILIYTFVTKKIHPFHKNYNKEITKTPKLFFMDLGLRNFILNNFNNPDMRNDKGCMFENFYLLELISGDFYSMDKINFWRTSNKTEIDFILQSKGELCAIEVKWKDNKRPRSFNTIEKLYPGIKTKVVTVNSFLDNIRCMEG